MTARAVLYLRVSSRGQLTDYEEDGLSIAAQQEYCRRKADDLGAAIVGEYTERAESAKTDDRPALRKMLGRIREQRDVDYVVVWKVDRFARNRRDDANMLFEIELAGARLISATENIDDTPAGRLMHGMLASFSEYYSRNLAAEVVKGSTQKAKRGGTPGIAPLGYTNVLERIEGRDIRTIGVDAERAPLIRWAFETYATGHYSINDIVELLEARGLRSRGNRRYTPRPLNHASVYALLTNDYYTGVVTYRDKKYPGRHRPLVTQQTFDKVQAVLRAHSVSGERDRKHPHYLKGTLYCGGCGRRLTYSENTGNGGTYAYFVCPLRQRKQCTEGYFRADRVEEAIERYYRRVELGEAERERVRTAVRAHLASMAATSEREVDRCRGVLAELDEQERKLLRVHYDDRISPALYDEEQARIRREREQVARILERLDIEHDAIEETLDLALAIVADTQQAYENAPPQVRRLLNQALFTRIEISHGEEIQVRLADPFVTILDRDFFETVWEQVFTGDGPKKTNGPIPGEGTEPLDLGSIRSVEVGAAGFEPATSRV